MSELSFDTISSWKEEFLTDTSSRVAQNAVATTPVNKVSLDRSVVVSIDPSMSHKVDTWEVTDQKNSGRCWLFSGLNLLRHRIISKHNIENFELSQNYLHFWDKVEKANWFITQMIDLVDKDLDDRTVKHLLTYPIDDGGQWDMFVSLVEKYGVVPKYAMPETESSSNTDAMNATLQLVLRRGAYLLRQAHAKGEDRSQIEKIANKVIRDCWQVISIHLGTPPTEFVWQFRNKDNKFTRGGTFTPQDFYSQVIEVDLSNYVCIVNDPRESSGYNQLLTVAHLGNVVGGKPIRYLNVEAQVLREAAKSTLIDGYPVWFGCDCGQQGDYDLGYWDDSLHDYESLYGIKLDMSKAHRMHYAQEAMNHAMLLTGVDILDDVPRRWRVENSWADKHGDKGFHTMSDNWFDNHMFEVAVEKKYLPAELIEVLERDPKVLPLWDPMGTLA